MSTYFTGNTREIKELRAYLNSLEIQRSDSYVDVVKRVILYMTQGIDVSGLLTEMIMATSTKNLVQKKLVYLYLCTYADTNAELSLLVVNTLQKDCRDENPIVRGLALRSLCSLRLPNIVEYITQPLKNGLSDVNAYVRKTAVLGCVKLFHVAPRIVKDSDVVDRLYALIRDRDAQVVANSVAALDEILADEGGMALNRPLALHLFQQLRTLNEWGQCIVLNVLSRFKPEGEDEVFNLLNLLDERLKHNNSAVALAAIKIFISITEPLTEIHEDVYNRVKEPLLTLLSSGSPELMYICLAHLQVLNVRAPTFLENDYKFFFLRFNDPSYIRSQKLSLLVDVATPNNAQTIIDELSEYVNDVNTNIACRSIVCLGEIARKVGESTLQTVVEKLLSYDELDIDYISAQTLVVIKDLVLSFPLRAREILDQLRHTLRVVELVDAKVSLLFILGEYGDMIDDAPYIIEPLINKLKDERASVVRLALLSATMKLFFKRPAEVQAMLGKLLQIEISGEVNLLTEPHDRALLYYRMLQKGIDVARKVIESSSEYAGGLVDDDAKKQMDKLISELNTLSVIYRKPSELFIQQIPPYVKVVPGQTQPMDQLSAFASPVHSTSHATTASSSVSAAAAAPSTPKTQAQSSSVQTLLDTGITFSPSAPAPIASKEAPHTGTGSLLDDFLAPSPAAASKSTASASSGSSALQQLAGLNLTPAALAAAPVAAAVNPLRLGVLSRLEPAIFQSYWKGFTAMSNFQASLTNSTASVASIESSVTGRGQLATMASGGTGDLLKFYFYGQDLVKVTPSINYYVVTTKAGLPSDAAGRATPPLPALIGAVESYVRQSL